MKKEEISDKLMDGKAAAKYVGFSAATLAVWRCTKRYDLKFIKIGRSVRYWQSELDRFLERQQQA